MASIKTNGATSALNEDKYINKLYDSMIGKQKDVLTENQNTASGELDALNQNVQQQVNTNLGRADVEAQKVQQNFKAPNVSASTQQQIALAMDNQKKKNATNIRTEQEQADAEIERQRQLIGQQYAAAIQKAQADNDMLRAQQLYEAAKQEENQLNALKLEAGKRLAAVGDNSVINSMLAGNPVTRDTTGETWAEVLKNEESLNKVYDSAIESAQLEAQMDKNKALSEIEAAQAAEKAATDKNLTQAYVNAMQNSKNYNEVQNAYGLGSGNMAQQQLARALGLTGTLTDIRNVFTGNTADRGQKQFEVSESFRNAIANSIATNEKNRANALFNAAEEEEQALIDLQKSIGSALAAQGDYSVLGKLYGLTQSQINRLKGIGTSVKRSSGNPAPGGGRDPVINIYASNSLDEQKEQAFMNRLQAANRNTPSPSPRDVQIAEQKALMEAIVADNKAAARERRK